MRPGRALLIVPLLIAILALPMAPARADGTQTLGCPAYGYTMQVPAAWTVTGACSPRASATSGNGLTMTVIVEKHGYWNDGRSKASILGDARMFGTIGSVQNFQPDIVRGHVFLVGVVGVTGAGNRRLAFLEAETFADGRLYKFSAPFDSGRYQVLVKLMAAALGTIIISGSTDGSQQSGSDVYGVQVCSGTKFIKKYLACMGSDHTFSLRSFAGGHVTASAAAGKYFTSTTITIFLSRKDGDSSINLGQYVATVGLSYDMWSTTLPGFFQECNVTPQPGTTYVIEADEQGTNGAAALLGTNTFTLNP